MSFREWLLVVFVGCLFGSSFLLVVVVSRELGPLSIAGGRALVAALACWVFMLATRKRLPRDPVLILKLCLLGVFSYGLPFVLAPISQAHISTGLMAIINLMLPVSTGAISHFWPGGERATPLKALGIFTGLGGALILATPTFISGDETQTWAVALVLCSNLIFAVSFNITRSFAETEASVIATLAMTGAALSAVPAALWVEGVPHVAHLTTWGAWVALGLFPTALSFQIMYFMLPRVGATNFSTNAYISPIVAILLGIGLLGEVILPVQVLGMAVVLAGLLLMDGRLIRGVRRLLVADR